MSDKKMVTCYISDLTKERISNIGSGGFSGGVTYCAKSFAPFAKGSENFDFAAELIKTELIGKTIFEAVDLMLLDGFSMTNFMFAMAQLLRNGSLEIKPDGLLAVGPNDWMV